MTSNELDRKLHSLSPLHSAAEELGKLQADFVSTARMWAVDEVGAVVAHQLNEPMSALMLYLNEIREQSRKSNGVGTPPPPMWKIVEDALREAERVCSIMDRIGHGIDYPAGTNGAAARDVHANGSMRTNGASAEHSVNVRTDGSMRHRLTLREREVLDLITAGTSNKEGGHQLGISTRTFEAHRAHIMRKCGARNAADLVRMALSDVA